MGRVDEFLELHIAHRILINPERLDPHRVVVEAARCLLPRILHINPDVVKAFDLDALNPKFEVAFRNLHHIRGWRGRRLGCRNRHNLLRYHLPLMGVTHQRLGAELLHSRHERLDGRIWSSPRRQECSISMSFDGKTQYGAPRLVFYGREFDPMIEIEVVHPFFRNNPDLGALHVVFVAIHDSPSRLRTKRPSTGKYPISQHRG